LEPNVIVEWWITQCLKRNLITFLIIIWQP
jgi:hypothetical protein